ncbi:MAG: hypothetical protein KDA28_16505, partial [Phycisphaerales bacterium]|nr:hypothetical protein [Phycisphaerales bacterium]
SPTLFEDVIKTVTSCNVQWPSTKQMNARLCEVVGGGAFPSAAKLARVRPNTLRARCRVGYRDQRMIDLARIFRDGEMEEADLQVLDDDALRATLITLPGIGPYAANNIMQLLGRYGFIPFDSEALRHAKEAHGMTGSDATIRRDFEAHYARYGEHRFRSYWFELWTRY